jgi:major vault protein
VEVVGEVKALVIKPNTAFRMRAIKNCVCRNGSARVAGEEWMERRPGAFLPGVYEEVVATFNSCFLTDKKAVHVTASQTFKDRTGKER